MAKTKTVKPARKAVKKTIIKKAAGRTTEKAVKAKKPIAKKVSRKAK